MTVAEKVLLIGCSSTARIQQHSKAEVGTYPLKTDIVVRKLKWQHKVRNMPENRLPAIAINSCMGESNRRASRKKVG